MTLFRNSRMCLKSLRARLRLFETTFLLQPWQLLVGFLLIYEGRTNPHGICKLSNDYQCFNQGSLENQN